MSDKIETSVAMAVATVDGNTYLCNLDGNVLGNAFVIGGGQSVSKEIVHDFMELSLMGQLPTITVTQLGNITTRSLTDVEQEAVAAVQAQYARAERLVPKYTLISTVKAVKNMG